MLHFILYNINSICINTESGEAINDSLGLEWTLERTDAACKEYIARGRKYSLEDCKCYCKTNGASRLTYYTTNSSAVHNNCGCCAVSNRFVTVYSLGWNANIYRLGGNINIPALS